MADKVKAKVIGAHEIGGVAPGGTVELDPAEVNIPALVEAGHIELSKTATERLNTSASGRAES